METPFIYCNDNLKVMQAMPPGSIDLIYLDPPFNTGQVFAAPLDSPAEGASFTDVWKWDRDRDRDLMLINKAHGKLAVTIQHAIKEIYGPSMMAYLSFMGARLVEIHRLLKPSGSVFLHCDQTASHYLKIVMDAIWGVKNFRNDIAWCYSLNNTAKRTFPHKYDSLLYYAKDARKVKFFKQWKPMAESTKKWYRHVDEEGRRYVKVQHKNGKIYRSYMSEKGTAVLSWWDDIKILPARSGERTGYRTQKPLKLLERIINASTEPGDLVMDPFCGCATTCVAAHHLGRRWIGIDVSSKAYELVKMRLEEQAAQGILGAPLERIGFSTEPPPQEPVT